MMGITQYALLLLTTAGAGLVQSVTGFGSGIVMMLLLPSLLPVLSASAVSSAISTACNISNVALYRRHINWKQLIVPCAAYMLTSAVTLELAPGFDPGVLLRVFGGFLLLLSVWFLFFSEKVSIRPTVTAATLCALISGVTSALFGIGGPPMVLYYLPALKTKEEYLGTIQAFFLITGTYTLVLRVIKGIFTVEHIPMTLAGVAGILLGVMLGRRIVQHINASLMKKLVYAVLAVSGIINMLS